MSGREEIRVPELAEPISHYTDAVRAGDLLFVSGCVAVDGEGRLVGGDDVVAQARQVFANLGAVLAAAGATFADVVKVTVYLTDIDDRARMNTVRQEVFGGARPASTLVEVSALAMPGAKVEIEAVALLRDRRRLQRGHHRGRAGASRCRGRSHGKRLLVKDLIDTAGIRTTYGSKIYAEHVPDRDRAAVERLVAAGAVVVGKANLHEFAWGVTSQNPWYGTVQNPRHPGRTTGGSSGGNAAALAAGLCDLGLGTDTGCSIRLPASCCGLVGLKPSWGRIPIDGVFPLCPTLRHGRRRWRRTVADVARDVVGARRGARARAAARRPDASGC